MNDREKCLLEFAKIQIDHMSPIAWHIWKRAWMACKSNYEEHPYTQQLCEILGWQGGTIHQVLAEVKRLKEAEKATYDLK